MSRPLGFRSVSLLAAILLPGILVACAVAPPSGERIEIADESAIIIWDRASGVQHFIRRASFVETSGVKDFGFLVPTPSYPERKKAEDGSFLQLETLTAPRTITKRREINLIPFGCPAAAPTKGGKKGDSGVQVLDQQIVAGYHSAVLEVTKAEALSGWLKENGYGFGADLKAWVAPYVEKNWKVTAFKVARNDKGDRLATSPVRMTFPTDRPFFPYREPPGEIRKEQPDPVKGGRRLRIYFVADARYRGMLQGKVWPGRVAFANRVSPEERTALLEQVGLPADTGPKDWHLTEFEDNSSPRPGSDDVYFERDEDQATRERRPFVVITEPWVIDYVLAVLTQCSFCYGPFLLLVAVWWGLRWRRRKREKTS